MHVKAVLEKCIAETPPTQKKYKTNHLEEMTMKP